MKKLFVNTLLILTLVVPYLVLLLPVIEKDNPIQFVAGVFAVLLMVIGYTLVYIWQYKYYIKNQPNGRMVLSLLQHVDTSSLLKTVQLELMGALILALIFGYGFSQSIIYFIYLISFLAYLLILRISKRINLQFATSIDRYNQQTL